MMKGLGNLVNFAGSRHLYQQDIVRINDLNFLEEPGATNELTKKSLFNIHNFENAEQLLGHLWGIAKGDGSMLAGPFLSDLAHMHQEK